MDFVLTSDVLIRLTLNVAGYLVITLITYILLNRRSYKRNNPTTTAKDGAVPENPASTEASITFVSSGAKGEIAPRDSRLPEHPCKDVNDLELIVTTGSRKYVERISK